MTVDGVQLVAGDRVLVKNQTTGAENGIYVAAAAAWARAEDMNVSAEALAGQLVVVEQGTTQADTIWLMTTNTPIVLGSTTLTYALAGGPALVAEAQAARGSKASLDARLDVALNEDGTLKGGAVFGAWAAKTEGENYLAARMGWWWRTRLPAATMKLWGIRTRRPRPPQSG